MIMRNKTEIITKLQKAMEFYDELDFEYLPVKRVDIEKFSLKKTGAAQSKENALEDLRRQIGECQRCKLSQNRKNVVFGEGCPDAGLMFIGEGPGKDEDIQARPFVGEAGKLLTRLIIKLKMKREEVYIANIVKCRPPYNRNPEEDEIMACRPFIEKQIEIVNPDVIVCLGRISTQALLRINIPISKARGSFFYYNDIPVMPTFHPAYLLRNRGDKQLTWEDMGKVVQKLKQD
jgi:DNA polymerase